MTDSARPLAHPLSAGAREALTLGWRAGRLNLTLETLTTLVAALLPVAAAWLTKVLLDRLAAGLAGAGPLWWATGGLAVVGLLLAVSQPLTHYLRGERDRRVAALTQDRLFASVERFSGLSRFEEPVFLDTLRLAQQSGSHASGQVVGGLLTVGTGLLTLVGFVVTLLALSPVLVLLVLLGSVPTVVAQLRLSRRYAAMLWQISPAQRREAFYNLLLSGVDAAKEIRLFDAGGFLRARMAAERRRADHGQRRQSRLELSTHGSLAVAGAAMAGGGLLWAVHAASIGRLTIGDVSLLIVAFAGMQTALVQTITTAASAHQQLLLFDAYLTVTRAGPDLPVPDHPRPLPELRHGIVFRDVWFRYSDDHPWALQGVDLVIPRGATVALVGQNGAGKSTFVKLLCRFYDPTRGAILWDGVDLRDVAPAELRTRIGAVFQDFMCYDLTAAENIALGDIDAVQDPSRLQAAASLAGIADTLAALPRGYDTLLTRLFHSEADRVDASTGVFLSGGQWQRVALARAFLRGRRDLLILDEPSSGLDAVAEHELHTRLRTHRAGRTSILISHRLGPIRDSDRFVVFAGGQVVEQGSHDELMAADGEYSLLFGLQANGYRDPAGLDLSAAPEAGS